MKLSDFHRQAKIFKALGHPKRLEIVKLLTHRQLTMGDIQSMTGFPQANLSQHLRELKDAQVVVADRIGKHILYRLAHPNFLTVTALLGDSKLAHKPSRRETRASEVQDPVCHMWVEPAATHFQTIFKGATFFFCASGCRARFINRPERYV